MLFKKNRYYPGYRFIRVKLNWNCSSGIFCNGVVNCKYYGRELCKSSKVGELCRAIGFDNSNYSHTFIPDQELYDTEKV